MRMRYGTLVATVVVCAAAGLAVGAPEALQCVYVDGLDLSGSVCGGGRKTSSRMSVVGKPLSVAGKTYERGFGSQAEGAVGIRLDGRATLFKAQVGIDDAAQSLIRGRNHARMVFKVWTDGKVAWKSPQVLQNSRPKRIRSWTNS